MKILLLTDGIYPYTMGGMAKHSFYLAKYLSLSGQQVHLVHCKPAAEENLTPEFQGFDLENISFQSFPFPSKGKFPGHYLWENKTYSQAIWENLKDKIADFDLIYAQGFTGWPFVREAQRGNLSVPVFLNLHGYEMFQKPPSLRVMLEHRLLRGMAKYLSLHSDFVFSFGGKISQLLKEQGISEEKILENPIGIEAGWLVENPKKSTALRKFIFIGRYERRKGVPEISAALRQILAENTPEFEFHFIGPIPEAHRILAPQIIYHGEIKSAEKVQEILRTGDILVCPSHSEGMPTVIMEAMASGLALLVTDVGAVSRQYAENGWLISHPDVALLKTAMLEAIYLDPEKLDTFKIHSLHHVKQNFIWSEVVKRKIKNFDFALAKFHKNKYQPV
ncbi:MAG: glycosyltransferase family 4 protein [Bacteroidia bacterium]|nr:glycosyltransferase family 4 protein [Bacteroidia bacterium]